MKMLSAFITAAYIKMHFQQVLIMDTKTDIGRKKVNTIFKTKNTGGLRVNVL